MSILNHDKIIICWIKRTIPCTIRSGSVGFLGHAYEKIKHLKDQILFIKKGSVKDTYVKKVQRLAQNMLQKTHPDRVVEMKWTYTR